MSGGGSKHRLTEKPVRAHDIRTWASRDEEKEYVRNVSSCCDESPRIGENAAVVSANTKRLKRCRSVAKRETVDLSMLIFLIVGGEVRRIKKSTNRDLNKMRNSKPIYISTFLHTESPPSPHVFVVDVRASRASSTGILRLPRRGHIR